MMSFLPAIVFIWIPISVLAASVVFLVLFLKEKKKGEQDQSFSKKEKTFLILTVVAGAIFAFFLIIDLAVLALVGLFMASM